MSNLEEIELNDGLHEGQLVVTLNGGKHQESKVSGKENYKCLSRFNNSLIVNY